MIGVTIICVLLAGCSTTSSNSVAYRGDGTFQNLSGRAGPFISGYSVTMPEFDLGMPRKAEYELANLKDIGKECGVYLAIVPKNGQRIAGTDQCLGKLEFELLDSKGQTVISASGKLGEYIWSEGGNYELYQLGKSFFVPNVSETYRLKVSYEPDERLTELRGFVYLRCGGSK
jgi:hypothetical protein